MTDSKDKNGEPSNTKDRVAEQPAVYRITGEDTSGAAFGEETKTELSIASSKTRLCQRCGKVFKVTRAWSKFCSAKCRKDQWDKEHPRIGLVKK